ncbi:asparagine synthase (glutamine-hydrolyzing) [Chryseobacterium phosphatilyticum]|uniref:asparagine synthase (glutamine-hydrolyzing) n=1 Tax=Chryseobacterium phosphatilyticum TaxID=475075 RepID=A0A316XG49_9FLAO|nr:asparagine synthase (glutamine-hydrolyzing) [Chryseobacterium phosphatilyticum]PWN70388.1 asparagine synthase (glutamine-hydrolyzing) [Chryseobacterium phosphatilyticum]
MCGIAGFINKNSIPISEESLKKMTDKLSHRGPDAEGFFIHENIGLGHRRLSIIDVSEAANQPFTWEDKQVLVFNGAIYNYLEIREELIQNNYTFKTNSDTEVLIAAYHFWGRDCVQKFNGMWAFAIFDPRNNTLFCSRDRFGVKPFYYYVDDQKFLFASEIKPILEIEKVEKVNLQILLQYLIFSMPYETGETFFDQILKLPGSHNLVYDLTTNTFEIYRYYDIPYKEEINQLNIDESIALFEKEFENSIKLRLRSDVKIGSALSGGLDSSYVVSIASKILNESKKCDNFTAVTVGSMDDDNDESTLAKVITDTLKVNHDIVTPKSDEFEDTFEEVIMKHEEPFGGISVYMQKFLMKEANKLGIKVFLGGQGADEVLLGYSKYTAGYLRSHSLFGKIKFLKNVRSHYNISMMKAIAIYLCYSNTFVNKLFFRINGRILKDKYYNTIDFSKAQNLTKSYKNIFELQKHEIFYSHLPELLKWEDKNSMAYSVESRLPFLDYKLIELCLSINNNYKIGEGWSKYILRKNLEKVLPDEIVYNKRKIGFEPPIKYWWPRSEEILETINNSKIIKEISKKKFSFIADRELEWRLYNIAVWEKLYNIKM